MQPRWTFHALDAFNAAPILVQDTVYLADASGTLTALDLATGKKRWSFHSDAGFDATPLALEDTLYLGDMAGTFFAIDRTTGKQKWTVTAQSPIHAGANGDPSHILFGTDSGLILCLTPDGKTRWTAQADGRINAPPAIAHGLATFSSCDAHLRALRLADGTPLFNTDLENLAPGSACASDSLYFVGTDQGHVLALSAEGGTITWHFDLATPAMFYASPALSGDTLVIAARDNNIYGLNASTGARKWSFATGADVDASPVISGTRVYVPSKDRRLYVLSLADGKPLWTFETARPISAPVAIAQGVLILVDTGGTAYCLEPQ